MRQSTFLFLCCFESESYSVMSNSLQPMDCTVNEILQARILQWVAFLFSRESFKPRSSALQMDSIPAEPAGKPTSTGVGSLPLLQGIFPTQESKRGINLYVTVFIGIIMHSFIILLLFFFLKQTLELLYRITNAQNITVIVQKMLEYLHQSKEEYIIVNLVGKIAELAEKYLLGPES